MNEDAYYIMGGTYAYNNHRFGVVETDDYPYVTKSPDGLLWNNARHHGHLYKLVGPDHKEAVLERESFEALGSGNRVGVEAPKKATLNERDHKRVEEQIRKGNFIS